MVVALGVMGLVYVLADRALTKRELEREDEEPEINDANVDLAMRFLQNSDRRSWDCSRCVAAGRDVPIHIRDEANRCSTGCSSRSGSPNGGKENG